MSSFAKDQIYGEFMQSSGGDDLSICGRSQGQAQLVSIGKFKFIVSSAESLECLSSIGVPRVMIASFKSRDDGCYIDSIKSRTERLAVSIRQCDRERPIICYTGDVGLLRSSQNKLLDRISCNLMNDSKKWRLRRERDPGKFLTMPCPRLSSIEQTQLLPDPKEHSIHLLRQ